MCRENKDVGEERIKLLYEAIKHAQTTIFNIDWKARTLLMANTITVPIILGMFNFFPLKREALVSQGMKNPLVMLLVVISLFLLINIGAIFYFILKVISPRIKPIEKIEFPENLENLKDIDIFFPIFKGGKFGERGGLKNIKANFAYYKSELVKLDNTEIIEDFLLSELLSLSLIREEKTRTFRRVLFSMGINIALILMEITVLFII